MNKRKRIALMSYSLEFGGVERVTADLSVELARRGYDVHLFVMDDRQIAFPVGGPVKRLGPFTWTGLAGTLVSWQHPLGSRHLKRKYNIDVTISSYEYLNVVNLLGGRGARVAMLHNYRFQHEVTPRAKDRFLEWLFAKLSPRGQLVCVSDAIRLKAQRLYPRADVRTIHNAVNLDAIARKLNEPVDTHTPHPERTFVVVGRLTEQKNIARALRAFAHVRATANDARLRIVGSGHLETQLRQLSDELGLADSVEWIPFTDNPFVYMRDARALVLSSDYEGFGLVLAEALACGTPVVSVDCLAGPREIVELGEPQFDIEGVEQGTCGLLTQMTDEGLAHGMRRMLENDALYERCRAGARERSHAFSIKAWGDRWEQLIESL